MSLFRKPKKPNIQKRVFTQNDEEEEDDTMDAPPAPSLQPEKDKEKKTSKSSSKKSDKSSSKTKQTLLSFDDEEEGEVFQVKKSSHNKKVMRMFEKEKKKKEHKEEKKEKPKDKDKTEVITDDIVLVVNQSHKKPPTPPPPILSGRDALCAGKDDMSSSEDEETKKPDGPAHRFSKPDNFKKVLESGAIPDAAMIHAARKRRQRAREMGDFTPLEGEEDEESNKNSNKGRLVRDDDNEESDEERIDMDINMAKREQERRKEQFFSASQGSDQELDEWEDQQIRKGVTGAVINAAQEMMMDYETTYQQTNQSAVTENMSLIDPGVPRTPEMIAENLREQYKNVCTRRDENLQKLVRVQEDIEQATQELEEMKIKAPEAAEKFKFYQELRGYITDLVECFDEKIGLIANLETRALDLMANQSNWLIERRRQDVRDQAEEATKGVQIRKGHEDEEKVRRVAEREGRRTRRRKAREVPNQTSLTKHVEGMSSDDEISPQDVLSFDKERAQIEQELQEVFEDVVEDYSSAASILIRFEQWRSKDFTAYSEAYATLCLPKVMSPLVRLNLVFWDPLHKTVELEKMEWYRTLALYGLHDNETEANLATDPDINMLPTIIDKVIIPKLTQHVDRCWDPLSSSQTLRLVGCVNRLIRKYPSLGPASKSLVNLFNAVTHKMKTALEHDIFIPVTPKLCDRNHFFQRQFSSGLKLLKNITSWQGIINDNKLKELGLTSLLNRYLLSSLKFCQLTDACQKIRLICQILPRVWFQENNTLEFKMFSASINNLYQQLDKDNPLHLESIDILNGIMKTLRSVNI